MLLQSNDQSVNYQWTSKILTNKIPFPIFIQFIKNLPKHHYDGVVSIVGEFIICILKIKTTDTEVFDDLVRLNKQGPIWRALSLPVLVCSSHRRLGLLTIPAAPLAEKGQPLLCRTRRRSHAQTPGRHPEPTCWRHNSRRHPQTPSWLVGIVSRKMPQLEKKEQRQRAQLSKATQLWLCPNSGSQTPFTSPRCVDPVVLYWLKMTNK